MMTDSGKAGTSSNGLIYNPATGQSTTTGKPSNNRLLSPYHLRPVFRMIMPTLPKSLQCFRTMSISATGTI